MVGWTSFWEFCQKNIFEVGDVIGVYIKVKEITMAIPNEIFMLNGIIEAGKQGCTMQIKFVRQ